MPLWKIFGSSVSNSNNAGAGLHAAVTGLEEAPPKKQPQSPNSSALPQQQQQQEKSNPSSTGSSETPLTVSLFSSRSNSRDSNGQDDEDDDEEVVFVAAEQSSSNACENTGDSNNTSDDAPGNPFAVPEPTPTTYTNTTNPFDDDMLQTQAEDKQNPSTPVAFEPSPVATNPFVTPVPVPQTPPLQDPPSKQEEEEPTRDMRQSKSGSPKQHPKKVWKEAKDPETGLPYYYHRHTRETTWDRPKEMEEEEEEDMVVDEEAQMQDTQDLFRSVRHQLSSASQSPVNPFLPPPTSLPLAAASGPPAPVASPPQPTAQPPEAAKAVPPMATATASSLLFAKSDYEDPITYMIMSDPVTCSDGHTYERSVIERCFEDRIQAERDRQQRQQQQPGATDNSTNHDATACCARADQEPIELSSPVSNQVVTGTLVPNFTLEQQIVRLMEANAFGLDASEIREWNERRCQKKERDAQRREEERPERERLAEQRRNAVEAQARRDAEQNADPSRLVRLDTATHNNHSSNNTHATGFVVRLADPSELELQRISSNNNNEPSAIQRCAVDRCVVRLERESSESRGGRCCPRCARNVCQECLAFGVADWENPSSHHSVCVDCVTQVVEVTEGCADPSMRARRSEISRELERHLMRFSNRASLLHEKLVRREANQRHGPRLVELEYAIGRLEEQHQELQNRAEQAEARAAAAQADDSDSSGKADANAEETDLSVLLERKKNLVDCIERIASETDSLEQELSECTKNQPTNERDEAAVIRYVEKMSSVSHRLEERKLEMAIEMSNLEAVDAAITLAESEKSDEVLALEADRDHLAQEYERLSRDVVEGSGKDFMEQVLELSTVSAKLEETQAQLTKARSVAQKNKKKHKPQPPLPDTARFIRNARATVSAISSRRQKRLFLGKKKRNDSQVMQDWALRLDQLELEVFSSSSSADARLDRARDLLELLDEEVCDSVSIKAPSEIGLEAARVELVRFLASTEQNENGVGLQRKQSSDTSDVFSDAMTDLLCEENEGADTAALASSELSCPLEPEPSFFGLDEVLTDLDAIGKSAHNGGGLPLGLGFPTPRMIREVSILRNTAELRKLEYEQSVETEWASRLQKLETQLEETEEAIKKARGLLADAEANAEEEEERQKKRLEERRLQEKARLERERILREKAAKAEQERAELLKRHREEEAATQEAFSGAAGESNNGAESFGGVGDLRMCKRCRAGPIENIACSDLKAHNDLSGYYKGNAVHRGNPNRKPNHCPHCNWFNANWKAWPYWDGVYGPH